MTEAPQHIIALCVNAQCGKRNRVRIGQDVGAVCGHCKTPLFPSDWDQRAGLWRVARLGPELEGAHFWRSDREAVFFRHVPEPDSHGHYELVSVDIETGRQIPLEEFNRRHARTLRCDTGKASFLRFDIEYRPRLPRWSASPDGRFLAWIYPGDGTQIRRVASLDGTLSLTWSDPPVSHSGTGAPVWFRDSCRWAMLLESPKPDAHYKTWFTDALIHDVSWPDHVDRVQFMNLLHGVSAGVDAAGRVLVRHPANLSDKFELSRSRLRTGSMRARRSTVYLPQATEVTEAVVSPQGDLLAWAGRQTRPPQEVFEIAVCRLYTSQVQPLARLPLFRERAGRQAAGYGSCHPRHLQWHPSGRWVSFCYADALWTVSVESHPGTRGPSHRG